MSFRPEYASNEASLLALSRHLLRGFQQRGDEVNSAFYLEQCRAVAADLIGRGA